MTLAGIEADIDACNGEAADAARLLALSEQVLEQWIIARGDTPTHETREGFRLLALHRQGARDLPSFNACRETCREIAYHYNLMEVSRDAALSAVANVRNARMMALVAKHLLLFVSGKMQSEKLGEFCCAARPLRQDEVTS
ncbi:MAG: hypothetical protein K2Y31_12580 [Burkholderiales bacterium]|jgi:hypothetical protein|nr:hypothetical protein [Burkholderiales bacterium]